MICQASLGYTALSRLARVTEQGPVLKKINGLKLRRHIINYTLLNFWRCLQVNEYVENLLFVATSGFRVLRLGF